MQQAIAHAAILVNDYDEAINFYTQKLHFDLLEDTKLSDTKRWVLVAPNGSIGFSLLLSKANNAEQQTRVGNQTGGRVFLLLQTDNLYRDYEIMCANKIEFVTEPTQQPHGTVAIFKDLYGNLWDFIQRS